jgi:hypothetical protein
LRRRLGVKAGEGSFIFLLLNYYRGIIGAVRVFFCVFLNEHKEKARAVQRLDSKVGNMMRTRRLHARLAYVVRVDDRASIAYSAAPARNVRRGVVSPEVLMRSLSSQCHASRI